MRITAPDLKELGIVDEIIPEVKGGAQKDVKQQAFEIEAVLKDSLKKLLQLNESELISGRYEKYRKIGDFSFSDEVIGVN
jgi:acetyl-CoA carboxylase carboxyl transferase subunit alpha